MKKMLVIMTTIALLAALACPAVAEHAALDAFSALMAPEETAQPSSGADTLAAVMAGEYAPDAFRSADVAAELDALAAVTRADIAAYASANGLPVAQVRNAYFKALAAMLEAEIAINPLAEGQYGNARAILALFLEENAENDANKQTIRGQMTRQYSRRIAEQAGLPQEFVEFVIMNEDWKDDDWKNDDDWRDALDWDDMVEDAFEDITIGSRDSGGSTRIADLQSLLISLGYLKGKADGVFGPRTQAALLEFQAANGLPATGVYNGRSLDALRSDGAVARWDYDDDLWDSNDYDTDDTGDTPNTPDTPNSPDRDTRNTLNTPDRDTRNTPDTPDRNTRNSPDTPAAPRQSARRNSPDTPDSPDD